MQDEVAIEDSSRLALTTQESHEAGRALSLYTVKSDLIRKMQDLGIEVETVGVVKIANGFSFMTLECLSTAMLRLTAKADVTESVKELREISQNLTALSNAMARQSKELKQGAAVVGGSPKGNQKLNVFNAGMVIEVGGKNG